LCCASLESTILEVIALPRDRLREVLKKYNRLTK
jgi:hypothetical protein